MSATPGSLSPATGRIRNSNSHWLNDRPLGKDLDRHLGRPVRLANDADCFALSEARDGGRRGPAGRLRCHPRHGRRRRHRDRRRLLDGAQGIAGEWGHNPLPWPKADELPGPPCWCGLKGCIETWLSGPGMAKDHARRTGDEVDARTIAASKHPTCRDTMERYVDRLARAFACVINLLDPDVIVLGGGLSNVAELPERVQARLAAHVFSDVLNTQVVRNQHGDSSGVRGAAWLWPVEAP